jgi:hypothetical protein
MAGTPAITSVLAQALFWVLLVYGAVSRELSPLRAGVVAALWLLARLAAGRLFFDPFGLVVSTFVAVLDIALVLMIFKADIRLR